MDLKTLLLQSLSNDGVIKKRKRLYFNNRCYKIWFQIHGKFLTIKNIRKIVKNKETGQHRILNIKKHTGSQQRSSIRQCILVDKKVQTHVTAILQSKSESVETEKLVTEEKALQTISDRLRIQATQTEIKLSSECTQTLKNTTFQVTQTETKILMPDKTSQTTVTHTADSKIQTDKQFLMPDKISQTMTLVTTDHTIQTVPGFGMPDKRSQTTASHTAHSKTQTAKQNPMPNKKSQTLTLATTDHTIQTVPGYGMPDKKSQTRPLYTADNIAQTVPRQGMPDKRSQTNTMYTAHNKTQTDKQYLTPDKNSQTLTLITADHTVQTISGYGMPNKISQTILTEERASNRLNCIPTFVADHITQTDNETLQQRSQNNYCHNCNNATKTELNDRKEQAQVEKDAVVLMLNEIGEMIINQNYLLHNNSTLLSQISEMTLLQKMVSRQNSTMKFRTKLQNQRKIRNYIRERSKKIRYVYYETTKMTKTSNALLQTIAYQLNVSTQTRKEDFPIRKITKVRKLLSPLAYKFVTQETRNHRRF